MQRLDYAPDELSPDWDEDTIYCAATYQPEDVLYEGSEDEDYDTPTSRRLRYEAAGQKFLDGSIPLILSATLRGPFEKSSGWVNPWRSKHRTAAVASRSREPQTISASHTKHTGAKKPRESQPAEIADSFECHLPSPESLKQVAISEPHAYLEDDELAMVQSWRTSVCPALARDDFWASHAEEPQSLKKRKAKNLDWLKTSTSKRRKTDMDSGSVNTPTHRRRRSSRRDDGAAPALHASFNSAPGRMTSPTNRSSAQRQAIGLKGYGEDELMNATFASFNTVPVRLSPPTKRISPRRSVRKSAGGQAPAIESEDELSQEKAAAATLSSPVSQQSVPRRSSRLQNSSQEQPTTKNIPQNPATHSESSRRQAKEPLAIVPTSKEDDVVMEEADGQENGDDDSDALQSQQDQSFCYKLRSRSRASRQDQGVGASVQAAQSPRSTLSPASGSLSEISDVDAIIPQTTETTSLEPTKAAHEPESAGKVDANTTDGHAPELLEPSQLVTAQDASLLAEDIRDEPLPDTEPETQDFANSALQEHIEEDSAGGSDDGSMQSAPTTQDQISAEAKVVFEGEQRTATNQETTIAPMVQITSKPQTGSEDVTMADHEPTHSSVGITETETVEISHVVPTSTTFADDKEAMSHAQVSSDFSLRSMFQRLVPTSPWARRSSLDASSKSSPIPSTAMDEIAKAEQPPVAETPVMEHVSLAKEAVSSQSETPSAAESRDELPVDEDNDRSVSSDEPVPRDADDFEQEPVDLAPTTLSQQSPWAKSQLSQYAPLAGNQSSAATISTPERAPEVHDMGPPQVQTPWATGFDKLMLTRDRFSPLPHESEGLLPRTSLENHTAGIDSPVTFRTPAVARPSTPEPQFTVKSFASFMSPSPQRPSRHLMRPRFGGSDSRPSSVQGIWSSAAKSQGSSRSSRRVSWAPLPCEAGEESESEDEVSESTSPEKTRPASPPPAARITDLPKSGDLKFRNHFTAVASRSSSLKKCILPTASQRTLYDPEPQAMAEKFLDADQIRRSESADAVEEIEQDTEGSQSSGASEPLETQDLVSEVFDDMADFLAGFDIDVELDQARKADSTPASAKVAEAQGLW